MYLKLVEESPIGKDEEQVTCTAMDKLINARNDIVMCRSYFHKHRLELQLPESQKSRRNSLCWQPFASQPLDRCSHPQPHCLHYPVHAI